MTIIEFKHISYQVKEKQILHDVSFKVDRGDFLTLVGPSGSGKSTILKLTSNLISPTAGDIFYQDKKMAKYDPVQYRREVSYCFQQPSLFGKTVRENLIFPYEIRRQVVVEKRIDELLKLVDLSADFLDKDINSLSGGEKQRVALIRNIVFLPKVLLLDEVTTGLDDDSKEIVHQLIKRVYEQGTTIIRVTHDQSEIQTAGHIMQIKQGRIIK